MPFASRDGVRLYWKLEGAGERPVLLLLNSIGTDISLWDPVVPYLTFAFCARGHGASDASKGDYSLEMLAGDTVAVMQAAAVDRAAVAGMSLGGPTLMATADAGYAGAAAALRIAPRPATLAEASTSASPLHVRKAPARQSTVATN